MTALPAQCAQTLASAVEPCRELLFQDLPPQTFFTRLLAVLSDSIPGRTAGVWMVGPAQTLNLYAQAGMGQGDLPNDGLSAAELQQLLRTGIQLDAPRLCSESSTEESPQRLLLPLRKADRRVGVLLVNLAVAGLNEDETTETLEAGRELLRIVESYLDRMDRLLQRMDPATFQTAFENFTRRLFSSLNPVRVASVAVKETVRALHVERVMLVEKRGHHWRWLADTDRSMDGLSPRQVRQLGNIFKEVGNAGIRIVYPGETPRFPPSVIRSLDDFLKIRQARGLVVEPLFRESSSTPSDASPPPVLVGALVCEQLQDELPPPGLLQHLPAWTAPLAMALTNAREHQRVRLLPGLAFLGQFIELMKTSRAAAAACGLALLGCVMMMLLMVPCDLQIASEGRLVPQQRQQVFAATDGTVAEIFVREAEVVAAGQPLLQLRSPQIELRLMAVKSQLASLGSQYNALRARLRETISLQNKEESARLQADVETILIQTEAKQKEQVRLEQQQRELLITAPIAGTVVTQDLRETLLDRPIQAGVALLELYNAAGPWKLELEIPELRAGHVLDHLQSSPRPLVRFRLAALPDQIYSGHLVRIRDHARVSQRYGTALPADCELDATQLATRRIGAAVTAQIHCGRHSLLYAFGGSFWEMLQRQWWFRALSSNLGIGREDGHFLAGGGNEGSALAESFFQ